MISFCVSMYYVAMATFFLFFHRKKSYMVECFFGINYDWLSQLVFSILEIVLTRIEQPLCPKSQYTKTFMHNVWNFIVTRAIVVSAIQSALFYGEYLIISIREPLSNMGMFIWKLNQNQVGKWWKTYIFSVSV